MTNWLERAKREIPANWSTANTAKRNLTAVTAVPQRGQSVISRASNGTIGSTSAAHLREIEARRSRAVLDDGEIIIAPATDECGLVTPATRNEISAERPDAVAAERIPEAPKRIAAAPIAMDE